MYSATVCFKRGDTWRGEQLVAIENLTVTAYGTGDKPVIMASPENGGGSANASKWTDMGNNIWRYEGSQDWDDVGNIIFDDGASFAKKITQLYVMNEGDIETHGCEVTGDQGYLSKRKEWKKCSK